MIHPGDLVSALILSISFLSCGKGTEGNPSVARFRGVNFSVPVSEENVAILGDEWRADTVRFQMSPGWPYPQDPAPMEVYDAWLLAEKAELRDAMDSCARRGIRVIIDLHWPPGGTSESYETRIFYDEECNKKFIAVWEQLASEFKDHPALLGYDLINEPHQNSPPPAGLDFLSTQARAIEAIRGIDPSSLIFVAPAEGGNPNGFSSMGAFPDSRIVYEVHMYIPHAFTLQGIDDLSTGPWGYPGVIEDQYYDAETLREILEPVRDFQERTGARIFVGEFSAVRWAPGAADYLRDCIALFELYGWDWAYHDYAAWDGFNLIYDSGTRDLVVNLENDRLKAVLEGFARRGE